MMRNLRNSKKKTKFAFLYYIRVMRAYAICTCNYLNINTLYNNSSYVAISGTNAA